ncbi:sugar ABC transporter substrate-binding protein [Synergistales bacterium]|nr:sugar ABC transporter substrate-binding protein [Synergistales bacterium]
MKKWGYTVSLFLLASVIGVLALGYQPVDASAAENKRFVIGVSQCHMNTPYRVALTTELQAEVEKRGLNWELILTDGQNNPNKQVNDAHDLMAKDVDLIIMAPTQSAPLTPVVGEIMDAGIPVLLVDRTIIGDKFSAFVGGDNINAGEVVAKYIIEKRGDSMNVVEMQGTLGASATNDRHKGFRDYVAKYPNIKILSDQTGDFLRDKALALTENILQANDKVDVLYCHSDNMALGAIEAIDAAGRKGEMFVFGTDGQKQACDKIRDGSITGTVFYPTGAVEAVDIAYKILNGQPYEKVNMLPTPLITIENVDEWYDRCF